MSVLVLADAWEKGERPCWGWHQPIKLGWLTEEKVFWWGRGDQFDVEWLVQELRDDGATIEVIDKRRRIE